MAEEQTVLKDRFGRVHDYLRISLTDKCNLRCTYCMPENIRFLANQKLMQPDEIIGLAKIFTEDFGIRKIRLTGGEPLLRKEFPKILDGLAALGTQLAITTNGLLLHEHLPQLKSCGIRSINISLDSLDASTFAELTRRDAFRPVWENMQDALGAGFKVKLNTVVMRGINDHELPDLIRLTKDHNLHVRLIEFMPFDGNEWKWERVKGYEEMISQLREHFDIQKLEDKPNSTAKAYRVRDWKGTFAVISTITAPFCDTCNRIRLTAEGKIRNCLFARTETDLLGAWRSGRDVKELIRESIMKKSEKLGGLPEFQDEKKLRMQLSERAMVKIGG